MKYRIKNIRRRDKSAEELLLLIKEEESSFFDLSGKEGEGEAEPDTDELLISSTTPEEGDEYDTGDPTRVFTPPENAEKKENPVAALWGKLCARFPFLGTTQGKIAAGTAAGVVLLLLILLPVIIISGGRGNNTPTDPISLTPCTHAYEQVVIKEATCTAEGTAKNVCSKCDFVRDQITLSPLGHDYKTETKEAECGKEGKETDTCRHCKDTQTRTLPALEHEFEESVRTEATCTAEGEKIQTCKNCKKTETEPIPALEHVLTERNRIEPTCAEEGLLISVCSVCRTQVEEVLPLSDHEYEAPTCTEPAKCRHCSAAKGEALGHDFSEGSCIKLGQCSRCSAKSTSYGEHNYVNNICTLCMRSRPYEGEREGIATGSVTVGEDTLAALNSFSLVEKDGTLMVMAHIRLTYSYNLDNWSDEREAAFDIGATEVLTADGSKLHEHPSFSYDKSLEGKPSWLNSDIRGYIYFPYEGWGEYILRVYPTGADEALSLALTVTPDTVNGGTELLEKHGFSLLFK